MRGENKNAHKTFVGTSQMKIPLLVDLNEDGIIILK
jgi:hypothetical protein